MSTRSSTDPAWFALLATCAALTAFAANSLLCRAALGSHTIDAASFTTLRLVSGTVMLWAIVGWSRRGRVPSERTPANGSGSWLSGVALFAYAIGFSWAYHHLSAGTGALLLFGSVQTTMIAWSVFRGEHPRPREWIGLTLAIAGLVYLVFPGLAAPPLPSAVLMIGAGIAWGIYSIRGRRAADPLLATAGNFVRSLPWAVAVLLLSIGRLDIQLRGILFAVVSGAITSGLGYVVWYRALRNLTATRAAIVQLSVPVLTALGGVALLSEHVTMRLSVAALIVLGGVALAVLPRR